MASYSVFTKPWKDVSVDELIQTVKAMGYDSIEYPLRGGYQVGPDEAEAKLPGFAARLRENGVEIIDVASVTTEPVFAACAAAGIPMIRTMFIPPDISGGYLAVEEEYVRSLEKIVPLCEKYGVVLGIQMHNGNGMTCAADMMRIVSRFDARYIGAIWDAAHSGLAGEVCEQAIDLCWSHLKLVNFKNARYQLYSRTPDGAAEYKPYFCPGTDGQCSWPRAVAHLKKRGYTGNWCMPAEYTGLTRQQEEAYAARDLKWLKQLVEGR